MCEYVNQYQCKITQENCPFVYYCDKKRVWLPSDSMPKNCKIKQKLSPPKGHYKVVEERKGCLYVIIGDQTYKFPNPFDIVPEYVQVYKRNGQYHIKK